MQQRIVRMVRNEPQHGFAIDQLLHDPFTLVECDCQRERDQQQSCEVELEEQCLLPQWHRQFGKDARVHPERSGSGYRDGQHRNGGTEPPETEASEHQRDDRQE